MTGHETRRKRPSLSMPILRNSRAQGRAGTLTLGSLLTALGEASFGWAIVVFSLVTLLPLPPGLTLITALPLLVTTGQMLLGYTHMRLPRALARLPLDQNRLRRVVLGLRPVTRRLERVLQPRFTLLFARRWQRPMGALLFLVAFALFLPVPFTGWFPALSLFTAGVGIVERDGVVTLAGIVLGGLSVVLTLAVVLSVLAGADALIH